VSKGWSARLNAHTGSGAGAEGCLEGIVGIDGGIDGASWQCALACEKSGFGVLTADKKFLKVDADGNAKMLEALKGSDKTDHLRVNASGDVEGDTI